MSAALLVQTRKEVRALLPWTIGVATASVALAVVAPGNGRLPYLGDLAVFVVLAYAFGALAISALSLGQELTHGTLAALLVQPLDRIKVLALKLSVVAIALVSLGLVANATFRPAYVADNPDLRRLVIWGPVVAGIGLTPLLTLLSRRPLGGVVFSPTVPGLILVISERLYPFHLGTQAWTVTWYGTLIASAAGLAMLVGQFRRLEVAGEGFPGSRNPGLPGGFPGSEDRGLHGTPGLQARRLDGYSPTVRRPWVWLLVRKELRLQQMTFAVSGLYVLAAVATMILAARNELYMGPTFGAISMIHVYCIPIIAGSLSSAEERHMGTLAGQVLQPRNMRVQWTIKAIVTIGISLLLTYGLPLLLMAFHRPVDAFRVPPYFVLGVSLIGAAAMWVSSISANALWALLACFPVTALAAMIGGFGNRILRERAFAWVPTNWSEDRWRLVRASLTRRDRSWLDANNAAYLDIRWSMEIIQLALIAGFGVLVLSFAARNHRSLDRNTRRTFWQVVTLVLFAAAATTGFWALSQVSSNWLTY
ncbi:MAG TPA: ABC transporter permease subunit [Vicinamibacterales bacterium]|nr:ABC transporter permease subunit [Vicinamibacterales bacterium]